MEYQTLVRASIVKPDLLAHPTAWSGHIPFAMWLVQELKPKIIVELGTHYGSSYFSFCRAVRASGLRTKCYAVDTWEGDGQAGYYGEEVFADVHQHNELVYSDISRLMRMTFDDALNYFSDASIDLLHIDGFHTYEAVKNDFENWLPKLTPSAVVLFHDTNVKERGFGVWRFWEELSRQYPLTLEFVHSHGLGVLRLAEGAGSSQLDWLDPGSAEKDLLVKYFGARGAEMEQQQADRERLRALSQQLQMLHERGEEVATLNQALGEVGEEVASLRQVLREGAEEVTALQQALGESAEEIGTLNQALGESTEEVGTLKQALEESGQEIATLNQALGDRGEEVASLKQTLAECGKEMASLKQKLGESGKEIASLKQGMVRCSEEIGALKHATAERNSIVASTSWRITRPLRAAVGAFRGEHAYLEQLRIVLGRSRRLPKVSVAGSEASSEPSKPLVPPESVPIRTRHADPVDDSAGLRVVFVSGEAHTPGHYYRVECYADGARAAGAFCTVMRIEDSAERVAEIAAAQVVVIWRAAWSDQVEAVIATARAVGARIVFDVDDLMIDPTLARTKVIDGIRSQGLTETAVEEFYARVRQTMMEADLCTVTTSELALHVRRAGLPVLVLPNGFDEEAFAVSRIAARRRAAAPTDGLLRIGYAGGSRTHQQDFALCTEALADVLRERSNVRLVLFRHAEFDSPLVDLHEFPELAELEDRVEWRDLVPVRRLPEEIARFDINLAPLEVGNPFCEAKSELKYFEAALVDVCTVASPTGPFRRAIRHGETGFLAATTQEWRNALVGLIDDAGLRKRMSQAARHDVLWNFGPERRTERMASVFDHLQIGRKTTHAFVSNVLVTQQTNAPAPAIPEYVNVFESDQLGQADVTVVVPLHNYAQFVEDALDSVEQQTLEGIDLIVVDDASTDDSLSVARAWAERNAGRFNRLLVLHNLVNAHLGPTRNVGFSAAETLYVLPLDADNRLLPDCLARCLETIRASRAAYAYPVMQQFGASQDLMGTAPYDVATLANGNYIDATALISKAAWGFVGGYDDIRFGWEDYDFWCRLAESGLSGIGIGGEPLAQYRVHSNSMLRTTTDVIANKLSLIADIKRRHPWLTVTPPPEPCADVMARDNALTE